MKQVLVLFLLLTLTACLGPKSSSDSVDLNMPYYTQQRSHWCWAAAAEMLSEFYGTDVRQCALATDRSGLTTNPADCCTSLTQSCNLGSGLDEWLDQLGIKYRYVPHTIPGADMRGHIDTGNPLALGLGNHFIIIEGYTPDGFIVYDPAGEGAEDKTYSEIDVMGLGWQETHLIDGAVQ